MQDWHRELTRNQESETKEDHGRNKRLVKENGQGLEGAEGVERKVRMDRKRDREIIQIRAKAIQKEPEWVKRATRSSEKRVCDKNIVFYQSRCGRVGGGNRGQSWLIKNHTLTLFRACGRSVVKAKRTLIVNFHMCVVRPGRFWSRFWGATASRYWKFCGRQIDSLKSWKSIEI